MKHIPFAIITIVISALNIVAVRLAYSLGRRAPQQDAPAEQTWPGPGPNVRESDPLPIGHYWVWYLDEWAHGYWDEEDWDVNGAIFSHTLAVGPRWQVPPMPPAPPSLNTMVSTWKRPTDPQRGRPCP